MATQDFQEVGYLDIQDTQALEFQGIVVIVVQEFQDILDILEVVFQGIQVTVDSQDYQVIQDFLAPV